MRLQHNKNDWSRLITSFRNSIVGLKIPSHTKAQKDAEWRIIQQHSLAKISRRLAEEYYAPKPLPPALHHNLNERIENSRNQLIRILREQNDMFNNDTSFVI